MLTGAFLILGLYILYGQCAYVNGQMRSRGMIVGHGSCYTDYCVHHILRWLIIPTETIHP